MELSAEVKQAILEMTKDASEGQIDRIRILLNATDASDEAKEAFLAEIQAGIDAQVQTPATLVDALKLEGMSDFIDSKVAEGVAAKDAELATAAEKYSTLEGKYRTMLTADVVSLAVAVQDEGIEPVEGEDSVKSYTEGLADMSIDELEEKHTSLQNAKDELDSKPKEEVTDGPDTGTTDSQDGIEDKKEKPVSRPSTLGGILKARADARKPKSA